MAKKTLPQIINREQLVAASYRARQKLERARRTLERAIIVFEDDGCWENENDDAPGLRTRAKKLAAEATRVHAAADAAAAVAGAFEQLAELAELLDCPEVTQ